MFFKEIILFLICFIKNFSYGQKNFSVFYSWNNTLISISGKDENCIECIPYRMKVANNGSIVMSIPRIYNSSCPDENEIFTTFIVLKDDFFPDYYFYNWPSDNIILPDFKMRNDYKIYSIMGFVIDDRNERHNYYLLDQGMIFNENNTVAENTTKLVKVNFKGVVMETYYFNGSEYTNSLLTDIVIDHSYKYAYITDSGNLLNNQSIPKIIVLNLENKKIYNILNNHESFKPDINISIIYTESGNYVYDYFTNITGVNSIQISCDDKTIFYSSLKSKNIYSISTKDIMNSIKKFENSKDFNYLNDIKVNFGNKNFISESFLVSSKNNIFLINNEKGIAQISYSVDNDISNYNFNDYSEVKSEKFPINFFSGIDIYDGYLYLLDNHFNSKNESNNKKNIDNFKSDILYNDQPDNQTKNETIGKFVIYKIKLNNEEFSYKKGCNFYYFELNIFSIFLWIWFIIIIMLIIVLISFNETKNNKKNMEYEKEKNIKELNKQLNEKEDENEDEVEDEDDN